MAKSGGVAKSNKGGHNEKKLTKKSVKKVDKKAKKGGKSKMPFGK
jgi:hypothetical protein